MSFYVKINDFDLGTIEIENIFINDFMPSADGLYVKVYLLALKLASDYSGNKKFGNKTLSDILNVPLSDILKAWKYWESKSIINITNKDKNDSYSFDVEFVSLRQLFINENYYSPERSKDLILKTVKNEKFSKLFARINENLTNELQANERYRLMEFLEENDISDDLVVESFISLKRGAYSNRLSIVTKRLFNWIDLKITTVDELQQHKNKTSKKYLNYKKILKSLGFPWQDPTSGDIEVIDKWINEYSFTNEFILDKLKEITKKVRNPSMNYLDAVFTGIYNGDSKPEKKESKNSKTTGKKNKFHNFDSEHDNSAEEKELEKLLVKNLRQR